MNSLILISTMLCIGSDNSSRNVLTIQEQIQDLEKQLQKSPKSAFLHARLALLYVKNAQEQDDFASYEKAAKLVQAALKLKPDHSSALYVQTLIHSANHRFHQCLSLAQKLYKKYPRSHRLLLVVGDAQFELGEYDQAEKTYQLVKKKSPRIFLSTRMARLAFVKGKLKSAIKLMNQALEGEMFTAITNESRAWYLKRMGELYLEVGNLKKAEAFLTEAREMHPKYAPTLGLLAQVRAAQGKHHEAIALYKKGIELTGDLGMLAELGDLYLLKGEPELAKKYHARFIKDAKSSVHNAHDLAEFYCNHDIHLKEALKLTEQDLKTRKTVHTYDAYAWALYKNKKYQEASAAMKQALKWGTKEADLLYHAGLIYLKLGQKARGRATLKAALELNPTFSLLRARHARTILENR